MLFRKIHGVLCSFPFLMGAEMGCNIYLKITGITGFQAISVAKKALFFFDLFFFDLHFSQSQLTHIWMWPPDTPGGSF